MHTKDTIDFLSEIKYITLLIWCHYFIHSRRRLKTYKKTSRNFRNSYRCNFLINGIYWHILGQYRDRSFETSKSSTISAVLVWRRYSYTIKGNLRVAWITLTISNSIWSSHVPIVNKKSTFHNSKLYYAIQFQQ